MSSSGLAVGLNKGHIVEKRTVPKRPSQNKRVRLFYNQIFQFILFLILSFVFSFF